jgi:hypothetical protein
MANLSALAINCSLKGGSEPSSTDLLVTQVLDELKGLDVAVDGPVRVADLDIKPGVTSDEGDGDEPGRQPAAAVASATRRRAITLRHRVSSAPSKMDSTRASTK